MAAIQMLVQRHALEVEGAYQQTLLGLQGAWLAFSNDMANPLMARMHLVQTLGELVRSHTPLLHSRVREAVTAAHHRAENDADGHYQTSPESALLEEATAGVDTALNRDTRGIAILAAQASQRYQLARMRMPPVLARQAALGDLPSQGRDVFVQLDRLQRKRSSAEFVSASLRMAMFATYHHAFAATCAGQGVETIEALHPEHTTQSLSLLDGWSHWCAENTHPNSRWHLQRKAAP